MELQHEFTVPGPPDDVFDLLLDLEQVARCMPGAMLTGREGDEYQGKLKLKVGPIAPAYEGMVVVADADRASRSATLKAAGNEINGEGGAHATVRATVHPKGSGSRVTVDSDVQIRGRVAQFGRGVLGDVAQRVVDQFAANLETRLVADHGAGSMLSSADAPAPHAPVVEQTAQPTPAEDVAESLDVLPAAGLPLVRRLAPALAGFLLGLVVGLVVRRRPVQDAPLDANATPPGSG